MYWTNNNVDATHLKAIVNFDYDDTTGFLKTRQPLGYEPLYDSSYTIDCSGSSDFTDENTITLQEPTATKALRLQQDVELRSMVPVSFIGAYSINAYTQFVDKDILRYSIILDSLVNKLPKYLTNDDAYIAQALMCVTLLEKLYTAFGYNAPKALTDLKNGTKPVDIINALKAIDFPDLYTTQCDTGVLHLFGSIASDTANNTQRCHYLQAFYKTLQGKCYSVDCTEVNAFLKANQLEQTGTLHFEIHDDTLYCTSEKGDRAFYAFKLLSFVNDSNEPYTFRLSIQPYTNTPHCKLQSLSVYNYPWQTYEYLINQTTLLEASVSGFNAARGDDIFSYQSNKDYDVTSPRVLGVWFTSPDAANAVITEPRIGQRVRFNIAINGYSILSGGNPSHAVFIFKKIESSVSDKYDAELINPKDTKFYYDETAGAVVVDYTFTGDTNIFEIVIAKRAVEQVTINYDSEDIIARQIINVSFNSASSTTKLKPYKLSAVKAHCVWNGHYCLWDADAHPNTLFLSYKDNFYYYPVPHNVLLFDSTIVNCVPYLDSLLVFTTNKLYQITETPEGVITQTVIQNDLPVDKVDASYLQVIKNMVLFKSGRYFYMVVPKSQSLKGELTVAPIYKNISGFLDNMPGAVLDILHAMYPERVVSEDAWQITTHPTRIYAEQDTVRILYGVVAGVNTYTLFLNYNTNLRAWTVYITDTTDKLLNATTLSSAREMQFIQTKADVDAQQGFLKCAGYTTDTSNNTTQLNFDEESQAKLNKYTNQTIWLDVACEDGYKPVTGVVRTAVSCARVDGTITSYTYTYVILNGVYDWDLKESYRVGEKTYSDVVVSVVYTYPLYLSNKESTEYKDTFRCLLDSGYRTLASSLKKRFREIQLKVYCPSEELTQFGSAFFVDGVERRNYTSLKESKLDDHTVTLAPDYDCNTFITEPTMGLDEYGQPVYLSKEQGSDGIELDSWSLDFSHFKREAPTTIRIPVSGKGYNPRFVLMSPSTSELQINSINWVYRTMNAR